MKKTIERNELRVIAIIADLNRSILFIPRAVKFLEERHYEQLPAGHIPVGACGVLGKAELEAIKSIMGS